jgi:hypothetical protein
MPIKCRRFCGIAEMLKPLVDGSFKDNIYIKQQLGLAYNKIGKQARELHVLKHYNRSVRA